MGLAAVLLAKIALLGPEGSPVIARIERNLASEDTVSSVAIGCGRAAIEGAMQALESDAVICTDGDVATVWRSDPNGLRLIEAVPIGGADDRSLEIVAARVTLAVNGATTAPETDGTMTIVANLVPPAPRAEPPPPPSARVAPPFVFSAGPTLFGSSDGTSVGFQLQAEIGVGRLVAVTPWVGIVPAPRHIDSAGSAVGTAEYRPTLFGTGINIPLLGPGHVVVPRLGAGYAMLWVHTWPDRIGPAGVANKSEDLIAPVFYVTAATSVRLTDSARIVLEGMLGAASNEVDIRLAGSVAAAWGDPLASVGIRGEYLLR